MYPGIVERMQREVTALVTHSTELAQKSRLPKNVQVKVIAPPNRKHLAWIGGSIVASHSTFDSECMTKAVYEEFGASRVHWRHPQL